MGQAPNFRNFCDLFKSNSTSKIISIENRFCHGCGKQIDAHVVREYIEGNYLYWCSFKCFFKTR